MNNESKVVELLHEMCVFVEENEPRTLKYQLHREINKTTGEDDVVMWETYVYSLPLCVIYNSSRISKYDRYEDSDAQKAHEATDEFKRFYRTVQAEDLVTGPTQLKFLKVIGGFSRV
jgi:quinol monooxygenase YgiN